MRTCRDGFLALLLGVAAIALVWGQTVPANPSPGSGASPNGTQAGPGAPPAGLPPGMSLPPGALPNDPAEDGDIREIRGVVHIPNYWLIALWVVLGLLLFAAIAAAIFILLRRRRERRAAGPPPVPPFERALQELEEARRRMRPEEAKDFAVAVSDVVRRYLERQFAIPAPERTTEEFLAQFSGHRLMTGGAAARLQRFLESVDLVKFAGQEIRQAEMEELFETADGFVREAHRRYQEEQAAASPANRNRSGSPKGGGR